MASITFDGESSEIFANMLQHIAGYTVEIVPEYTDHKQPEPFDAVVIWSASDELNDYFAVRVRKYDKEIGEAVGDPFAVVVSAIKVY